MRVLVGVRTQSSICWFAAVLTVLLSIACGGGGGSKSPTAPGGSQNIIGSGVLGEKSFPVGGFTAVEHDAVGSLFIEQSASEELVLIAEDNILQYFEAQVSGETLRISLRSGVGFETSLPIMMRLGAASLERVELRGVGSIECDQLVSESVALVTSGVGGLTFRGLDVDSMDVTIAGVGAVRTSGSTRRQDVVVDGLDDYQGKGLVSAVADVEVRSLGSATVRVSDRLVARVSGSGCVYYVGSPTVEAEITGSGCVEKIGN